MSPDTTTGQPAPAPASTKDVLAAQDEGYRAGARGAHPSTCPYRGGAPAAQGVPEDTLRDLRDAWAAGWSWAATDARESTCTGPGT